MDARNRRDLGQRTILDSIPLRTWHLALSTLILLASACIIFAGTTLWRLGSFRAGADIAHLTVAVSLLSVACGVISHPYLDFGARRPKNGWRSINTISLGAMAAATALLIGPVAMGVLVCVDHESLLWERILCGGCVVLLPLLYTALAAVLIRKNFPPGE